MRDASASDCASHVRSNVDPVGFALASSSRLAKPHARYVLGLGGGSAAAAMDS
jgi:hypothetical protein